MSVDAIGIATFAVILIVGIASTSLVRYKNDAITTYKALNEAKDAHQRQCDADIADLRGQMKTLQAAWTNKLGDDVARRVITEIRPLLEGKR